MTSYIGKIISHVYGEDKLAQKDAKLAERDEEIIQKDAEIARLMQLLSQRDAELAQKETEISFYDAELARKDIELDRKNAELDQKDAELDRKNTELLQLLSQRDAELAHIKPHLVELQQSIRKVTFVEPVDIQVKLGEMFESWTSVKRDSYPSPSQLAKVATKIRVATEEIKEPIMDLFHVTYAHDDYSIPEHGSTHITGTAFILTASDVYKLEYAGRSPHENHSLFITSTMNIDHYSYSWVKIGSIDNSINWKTLRKYIKNTSGSTGITSQMGNSVQTGSADKIAERLAKNMLALVM